MANSRDCGHCADNCKGQPHRIGDPLFLSIYSYYSANMCTQFGPAVIRLKKKTSFDSARICFLTTVCFYSGRLCFYSVRFVSTSAGLCFHSIRLCFYSARLSSTLLASVSSLLDSVIQYSTLSARLVARLCFYVARLCFYFARLCF